MDLLPRKLRHLLPVGSENRQPFARVPDGEQAFDSRASGFHEVQSGRVLGRGRVGEPGAVAHFEVCQLLQRVQADAGILNRQRGAKVADGSRQVVQLGARPAQCLAQIGAVEGRIGGDPLDRGHPFGVAVAFLVARGFETGADHVEVCQRVAVMHVGLVGPWRAGILAEAVALVAVGLVGAPGVAQAVRLVGGAPRHEYGMAEALAGKHFVIEGAGKGGGGIVVHHPARGDHRLAAHLDQLPGQPGGQRAPARAHRPPCCRDGSS